MSFQLILTPLFLKSHFPPPLSLVKQNANKNKFSK